jgi:hypothetical protein
LRCGRMVEEGGRRKETFLGREEVLEVFFLREGGIEGGELRRGAGQEQCFQGHMQVQAMDGSSIGWGTNLEEEGMRIMLEDLVRALTGRDQGRIGWRGTNENERGMKKRRWNVWMQRGGR